MGNFYRPGLFLVTVAMSLSFSGCLNEDSDKDGLPDGIDKCPGVPGVKANNGCPAIPQIKKIHLYLDNSASMGGYYKNSTEYKEILTDLTVKMDKEIKPVDISFIARTITPYPKSVADFSVGLATTKMSPQKSSELHRMIGDIAGHCGPNNVSLLVSDCILSFSDAAIKANPNVNRENAASTLKSHIYGTFADLKKKGFAASVYGFRSKFFGTYYDYQNHKIKLNGIDRPFYIWVIAKKDLLPRFNTELENVPSFRPEESLHFGLVDEPVKQYNILPNLERKGEWIKGPEGVSDAALTKGQSLRIGAVLNLHTLPFYARSTKYLQDSLVITTTGCTATFNIRQKLAVDKAKLKTDSEIQAFDAASHVLLITVSDLFLSQANIHFSLPLKYNTWYSDWSTMDDKNVLLSANKTFAFEYLIHGVMDAYSTQNKNFIDFSLSLTK